MKDTWYIASMISFFVSGVLFVGAMLLSTIVFFKFMFAFFSIICLYTSINLFLNIGKK